MKVKTAMLNQLRSQGYFLIRTVKGLCIFPIYKMKHDCNKNFS